MHAMVCFARLHVEDRALASAESVNCFVHV